MSGEQRRLKAPKGWFIRAPKDWFGGIIEQEEFGNTFEIKFRVTKIENRMPTPGPAFPYPPPGTVLDTLALNEYVVVSNGQRQFLSRTFLGNAAIIGGWAVGIIPDGGSITLTREEPSGSSTWNYYDTRPSLTGLGGAPFNQAVLGGVRNYAFSDVATGIKVTFDAYVHHDEDDPNDPEGMFVCDGTAFTGLPIFPNPLFFGITWSPQVLSPNPSPFAGFVDKVTEVVAECEVEFIQVP